MSLILIDVKDGRSVAATMCREVVGSIVFGPLFSPLAYIRSELERLVSRKDMAGSLSLLRPCPDGHELHITVVNPILTGLVFLEAYSDAGLTTLVGWAPMVGSKLQVFVPHSTGNNIYFAVVHQFSSLPPISGVYAEGSYRAQVIPGFDPLSIEGAGPTRVSIDMNVLEWTEIVLT